jgi:hypothetical protein
MNTNLNSAPVPAPLAEPAVVTHDCSALLMHTVFTGCCPSGS